MELGTFGAVMGFALELEERAAEFHEAAVQRGLGEPFRQLARSSRKRLTRLERARREGVAEMILEPITGLDGDAYNIDLDPEDDGVGCRHQAVALEKTMQRFYQDAALKMPILEIARIFQRLNRENEQRRAQLAAKE